MVWYNTFNDVFFLTLATALFGFGGVFLQAVLKSRCKEFSCLCMKCVRDVAPPGQEPTLDTNAVRINIPDTPKIKRSQSV